MYFAIDDIKGNQVPNFLAIIKLLLFILGYKEFFILLGNQTLIIIYLICRVKNKMHKDDNGNISIFEELCFHV